MKHRRVTLQVMAVFALIGGGCMVLRYNAQKRAMLLPGDQTFRLRYLIDFEFDKPDAHLLVTSPRDTTQCRVYRETIAHPGLNSIRARNPRTRDQVMTVTANAAGGFSISAEFDLHVSPQGPWREEPVTLTADDRAYYLRAEPSIQTRSKVVTTIMAEWRSLKLTPEQMLARIYEHCVQLRSSDDDDWDAETSLETNAATPLGRVVSMIALCRAAKMPSRLVSGVDLLAASGSNDRVEPRVWMEVYINDRWVPFDPEHHFAHELPSTVLPIRRDSRRFARIDGGEIFYQRLSVQEIPPPRGLTGDAESLGMVFDLTRLPLPTQLTLALLLVLPIGALVTAFARVMIGIPTFGTFTPALLALSFVYAAWHTGVVILVFVLLVGIVGRKLLDRLKLLLVPRLGVLLTMVVLCMIMVVSFFDYARLTAGPQAVLLPIVILTMLVERLYITGEEDGIGFTLKRAAGTSLVAVCCFALMQSRTLGDFLVTYPEVHFITAALLVGIGRYTGYRLTELWRFYDLVQLAKANSATKQVTKPSGDSMDDPPKGTG